MSGMNKSARASGQQARARTAAAARRQPQDWGMGFLALLVLGAATIALGVLGGRAAVSAFSYAARMSGRPGELTVERCWGDNPSKPGLITSCAGSFHSDDGRTVTADSPISGAHHIGAVLPVDYGDGGFHNTGLTYAVGDLAGLFAVIPVGVLGLWLLCLAVGTTPAGGRIRAGLMPANNKAVRCLLWAGIGCLLAAGACLLVGVVGWATTP